MRAYYFIESLAKGLKIIELLAEKGFLTASIVSEHMNTSRAAGHRFLLTLRDLGYVEKTNDGRFSLTFKVLELGMRKLDGFDIRYTIRPFLLEISKTFSETVNLGHWDRNSVVHLDKIDSPKILRIDVGIGAIAPAYCTALGKAMLAFLPDNELIDYLNKIKLKAISPNTITTVEKLRNEIERIRQHGYAVDNEELSLGLRCVAAPIFDYEGKSYYAISVSGLSQTMTNNKIDAIQNKLRPICKSVSRQIGSAVF